MALQQKENLVALDQDLVGKYLRQFQISCQIAQENNMELFSQNDSTKEEQTHSNEAADEMMDQLALNLMKETWNIPSDEST